MPDAMRLLLLLSHTVLCEGMCTRLHDAVVFEVVHATTDPEAARDAAERLRLHAAVVEMPDERAVAACASLHAAAPALPIVLLGGSRNLRLIARALRSGGTVYLPPDLGIDDLRACLHDVREHGRALGPLLATARPTAPATALISPREREVLALVARGQANRRIGRALSISENTVRNHLVSIFGKLGVRDRTEAAIQALKRGLL